MRGVRVFDVGNRMRALVMMWKRDVGAVSVRIGSCPILLCLVAIWLDRPSFILFAISSFVVYSVFGRSASIRFLTFVISKVVLGTFLRLV